MALPPITNSPLYKALLGDVQNRQDKGAKGTATTGSGNTDTVTISEQALAKLQAETLQQQNNARASAGAVRDTLAQNGSLTLSANPGALPAG